jgi:hypothetical protein
VSSTCERAGRPRGRVWLGYAALIAGLLSGCGDFPRPFQGQPGATAKRLAEPPAPRLAIPAPTEALLTDDASRTFASAVATDLQDLEVPATAARVQPGDWQLVMKAEERGGTVVPSYIVENPKGEPQGQAEGKPVPVAQWAAAQPATLKMAADGAAPAIADLLTRIEAAIRQSDPNSLYNRPARVQTVSVTGAPGDGNQALTTQMRKRLTALGTVVQDTDKGADFVVQGEVRTVPIAGKQIRVEIQWIIKDAKGAERGRVVQLNEVPAGSLSGYWGDVAAKVAEEASGGVKDVILTQSGRR